MASSARGRRKNLICCRQCCPQGVIYSKDESLVNACRAGHVTCVKACLRAGADVNGWYPGYSCYPTPSAVAIHHRNADCVEVLIEAGAVISISELKEARENGDKRCVNLLLEDGADAEMIMCSAAKAGRCNILELLIKAGADVNKYGALVFAASSTQLDSLKCVNRLLQAGADVNKISKVKNCIGFSFLEYKTALLAAVQKKSLEIVKLLLKAGADVDMKSEFDGTALYGAARSGSKQCVALLLKAGADVNIVDNYGTTALFGAAAGNCTQCVEALLKAGANVNIKSTSYGTALFFGVETGSVECVDLLLKAGADVNVTTDIKGNTVLHQTMRSLKGVKKVLQEGIKVNIRNEDGVNALTYLVGDFAKDHLFSWEKVVPKKEFARLLFVAGETTDETRVKEVPEYLRQPEDINLMNICRETIRKHLLQMSRMNLIYKIHRLGLPNLMASYLLYDVTLDEDTDTDGDSNNEY